MEAIFDKGRKKIECEYIAEWSLRRLIAVKKQYIEKVGVQMRNLKISVKMGIIIILSLVMVFFLCIISIQSLNQVKRQALEEMESVIRADYDKNIKQQVEGAISVADKFYTDYTKGIYTKNEARDLAASVIRKMRYGESGYFWVDRSDGTNVVQLGSEVEGTNRIDMLDANGYPMIKEMICVATINGSGFTEYYYPKEGETEILPKRSFTQYYKELDWIIGTGNYIDYIDAEIAEQNAQVSAVINTKIGILFAVSAIMLIGIILVAGMISIDITRTMKEVVKHIDILATSDFSKQIPSKIEKRKDDFGILVTGIEKMRISTQSLVGIVKSGAVSVDDMMKNINERILSVNSEIEDVSATTQELSASMEQTAATVEHIEEMSSEIQFAAKNIAGRAQDGATEAEEIHNRAELSKEQTKTNKEKIVKVLNEISERLQDALKKAKVVNQIGILAESIMSIAEQTNLLSLNASIEAARAGDAGKGFAVVAGEIRQLADQSKQAVVNIQGVTDEVNQAVSRLANDANQLLAFVNEEVLETFDNFEGLADAYNKDATSISEMVMEFSLASDKLMFSVDGILNGIQGISTVITEGASGTALIAEKTVNIISKSSEMLKNAKDAEACADELQKNVAGFIV